MAKYYAYIYNSIQSILTYSTLLNIWATVKTSMETKTVATSKNVFFHCIEKIMKIKCFKTHRLHKFYDDPIQYVENIQIHVTYRNICGILLN